MSAATPADPELVPDERVEALRVATSPGWAAVALGDLPAVLSSLPHGPRIR